jgi:D-sedoheptulose 7-phosphate isomerase
MFKKNSESLLQASKIMTESLISGNKLLFCGNGGSAADCQHISAEFTGKFNLKRKGLSALALTTNTSEITAIGNDFSFSNIFQRNLESLGNKGDVLIAISTSGNSKNILNAVRQAKKMGIFTIGLTGKTGGKLSGSADLIIKVPTNDTQHIQECHIMIGHILVGLIESAIVQNSN